MSEAALNQSRARSCRGAEVESFRHLNDCPIAGKCRNGTACFVARHLNPLRWAMAGQQEPRLHWLGPCFAGPAIAGTKLRPHVAVRSREAILLERLVNGGARALSEYRVKGGYGALDTALTIPAEQIVQAIEVSRLRGRGGAAFPTGPKWRSIPT